MARPAVFALLLAAAVAPGTGRAEVIDRIAAVVNGDVILHSEVGETAQQVRQAADTPAQVAAIEGEVVQQLVGRKLIEQAMDKAGIQADEADVQRYLGQIQKQNGLDEAGLKREVERAGATWEEFIRDKRDEIRYEKFLQVEIRPRVHIAEEDIRSAYNQQAARAPSEPQVHLHMVMLRDGAGGRAETLERARRLADEVSAGRPFADVARAESALPNAAGGGDSGFVRLADLNPDFRTVIEALPEKGGVARPVETGNGVLLLAVSERRDKGIPPFEEVRDRIWRERMAEREDRTLDQWVEEKRRESHVQVLLAVAPKATQEPPPEAPLPPAGPAGPLPPATPAPALEPGLEAPSPPAEGVPPEGAAAPAPPPGVPAPPADGGDAPPPEGSGAAG